MRGSRINVLKFGPMERALVALLVGGLCTVPLWGQATTSAILGTVTDASGAAIPAAAVQVKNLGTGLTQSADTDSQGRFRVSDGCPGRIGTL